MKKGFKKALLWLLMLAMLIPALSAAVGPVIAATTSGSIGNMPADLTKNLIAPSEHSTINMENGGGIRFATNINLEKYAALKQFCKERRIRGYTKSDLEAFRDDVNNGNTYAGKTVVLMNNIDLGNEEWTPIGNSTNKFQGNFNGQNHTISNLKITSGNDYVGLFGYTTNGHISNLTIENAEVKGRVGVGALSGCPYTTSYSNITLKGLVKVDGMSYVGSVLGRNAYANITNITVEVEDGSYVRANSFENDLLYRTYVGGVIGFMGEGNHKVSNVESNIDVYGNVCDIGGIVGIAHYGNTLENITATGNVYLEGLSTDAVDYLEIGGIAGTWHNQNDTSVTLTNCEFTGEIIVTSTAEVELPTEFYYGGLVGKPYSASGTGVLVIDGVGFTA